MVHLTSAVLVLLALDYLLVIALAANVTVTPVGKEVVIWKQGDLGISAYRIPLLIVAPNGNLLAFSEARKHSLSDSGPKLLVVRSSDDGGVSWGNTTVIFDDGEAPDGSNLGTVLVDRDTKEILLIFTFCPHSCATSTTYLTRSSDNGASWTKPVNISQQIGTFVFAPGPGFGIQKEHEPHVGRLVSCGHGLLDYDGVICITSDDHGKTWRMSSRLSGIPYSKPKISGDFVPDEPQVVELLDGSLLITARNQEHYHTSARFMVKSYDGADSLHLEDLYIDTALVDPACQGSMVLYGNTGTLFFSNPASETSRTKMTLRWSLDNGSSWPYSLLVYAGPSAYSCLAALPAENKLALAFEKGIVTAYDTITLQMFSIKLN